MDNHLNLFKSSEDSYRQELTAQVSTLLSESITRRIAAQEKMTSSSSHREFLLAFGIPVENTTKKYEGALTIPLDISGTVFPAGHLLIEFYLERLDLEGEPTDNYEVSAAATLSFTLTNGGTFITRQFDVDKLAQMITRNPSLDVTPVIPWYRNTFVLDDSEADTYYTLLTPHDEIFPPEEEEEKKRQIDEAADAAKKEQDLALLFESFKMTPEQWDQALEEQWLGSVLLVNDNGRIGALVYATDEDSNATELPIEMSLGTSPQSKIIAQTGDNTLSLQLFGWHHYEYSRVDNALRDPNALQALVDSVCSIAPIVTSLDEWIRYLSNREV